MKKTIRLMALIIAIIMAAAMAAGASGITFTYEERTASKPVLTDANGDPVLLGRKDALVEINGERYYYESFKECGHVLKYSPEIHDFAKNEVGYYDIFEAGEYYITREAVNNVSFFPDNRAKGMDSPLRFYDSDFNLVREQYFGGLPLMAEYINGVYYTYIWGKPHQPDFIAWSTDTINWTHEDVPEYTFPKKIGNVALRNIVNGPNRSISASIAGNNFSKVVQEAGEMIRYPITRQAFGDWIFSLSADDELFVSYDGIYSIKATTSETVGNGSPIAKRTYEDGDDIIIVIDYDSSIRIPKQAVYDELERIKGAPYVQLNDTILAFDEPPVMESDRTLVPMRFLFEQMDATVDWEESTQTAIAQKDGTKIQFSINSLTADVDGKQETMDVPARLIGDKTMVPLRFLSENLGYDVQWDEDANMAIVTTP